MLPSIGKSGNFVANLTDKIVMKEIYFAGGCFWGTEHYFKMIKGVKDEKNRLFQSAFEVYDVNTSRLLRYAGRKGKKDEILSMISQLDTNRMQVIHKIQDVLSSTPVTKAWLFGSYSRMEERPDSDIDLLVDLDRQKNVGLFEIGKIALQLENAVGKAVDLVIDGAIKPFARESINHDKILIYERAV